MMAAPPRAAILGGDERYLTAIAAAESTRTLMRGFTSVRDVGGNAFGLKQAVDEGVLPGPRIYASGAMISVTSGHGDFRSANDLPGEWASRARRTWKATPPSPTVPTRCACACASSSCAAPRRSS